jgi:hypothetical protein
MAGKLRYFTVLQKEDTNDKKCLLHQDALRKLAAFEEELVDLRTVLRQDAASLRERRRRQRRKTAGKTGSSSSSSGDSGISDSYELSEQDLPRREEALNRLKAMAKQLEENLPPNSEALQESYLTAKITWIIFVIG